jgi:hypothetical protein
MRAPQTGHAHPHDQGSPLVQRRPRPSPQSIQCFATLDAAEKWFEENDPEGVAFEYEVLE